MLGSDDLFQKISFMASVHALVLAELLRSAEMPQHIVMDLMMITDRAFDLADTIPPEKAPAMAAFELIRHYMMMYAEDRAEPGYEKPEWLPEPKGSVPKEDFDRHVEWFIDGEWVTADPRWEGLPGETVLELDIAALLRETPALRPIEIAKAVSKSETRVLSALQALKHERAVAVSGRPARWSLSQSVLETLEMLPRRPEPLPPNSAPPPTIEDRILAALRARSGQRYQELAASVSLSVDYVRRHLHDMARKGLVKSSERPARWSLAKSAEPQKVKSTDRAAATAAQPAAVKRPTAKSPRRQLPKGLGRPLNVQIVNDIVAALGRQPKRQHFVVAAEISIAEDTIRRYLHDLETLGMVQQVGQRPKRWSLTADWAAALEKALASAVTDTRPPKRLARAGR